MVKAGCGPAHASDIKGDDTRRSFQISGDKPNKKAGAYCLKIDGDFAAGWFMNHRGRVVHPWHSKSKSKMTKEQLDESRKKIEAEKRKRTAEDKKLKQAAQIEANEIYKAASKGVQTPYTKRKKINIYTGKVDGKNLILPIMVNGKITSLQTIYPDGTKKFLKDGEIKGGYCSIAKKGDSFDTIIISESYSTGATIYEANGFPVVVAFNAGNLETVALIIRKKYPKSKIILAADNDQWRFIESERPEGIKASDVSGDDPRWQEWLEQGLLQNIGMEKARHAAAKIGGYLMWPDFLLLTKEKPTDFNDLMYYHGIECVTDRILEAVPTGSISEEGGPSFVSPELEPSSTHAPDEQVPLEAYEADFPAIRDVDDTDWESMLIHDSHGQLKATSLKNKILLLTYNENLKNIFAYNQFHQNIYIVECPPWEKEHLFKVHAMDDLDITMCASEFENYRLSPDVTNTFKAMQVAANHNSFNPAQRYFNGLKWDGRERLKSWLSYYLGCEEEDPKYLEFVGKKWMTAAVKRVFEVGCKFDHVLVMEGPQGKGKSTLLQELATFGFDDEESYFTDGVTLTAIQDKDTVMKLQGNIIVELAELVGMNKRGTEEIKRWITLQKDVCRLPYARTMGDFPRQFVLAGTTNDYEYLQDPSGNRRFWPCKVGRIDMHALKVEKDQLWAEAVYLYRNGYPIWTSEEEHKLAEKEQSKRILSDSWEDKIIEAVSNLNITFKTEEVMVQAGLTMRERDNAAARRIGNILKLNGYENKIRSRGGKSVRLWGKKND